jgi:amino-acid N-acetyltransferase
VTVATPSIRRAAAADLPDVSGLLAGAGLPLDGTGEAFATGLVAELDGSVVGAAAIEPHGDAGLLRSVVVGEALRGSGLGRRLVAEAERLAASLGVRDLYLLTETAIAWFPRLGYETLARDAAPPSIAGSVEFTVSCVDTGVLMRRRLAR